MCAVVCLHENDNICQYEIGFPLKDADSEQSVINYLNNSIY